MELVSYHELYMQATLCSSIGLICSRSINDYICGQSIDSSQAMEMFYNLWKVNHTYMN
jgi:hypothetical protein